MPEHPQVPKYIAAKAVTVPEHPQVLENVAVTVAPLRPNILWIILPEMQLSLPEMSRWRRARSAPSGAKSRRRPL